MHIIDFGCDSVNPIIEIEKKYRQIFRLVIELSVMPKDGAIEVEGRVTEVMRNATFKVEITNAKTGRSHGIEAYLAGKLYKNNIKVLEGDIVKIELSPYDLSRGRIIWREKPGGTPPPQGGTK